MHNWIDVRLHQYHYQMDDYGNVRFRPVKGEARTVDDIPTKCRVYAKYLRDNGYVGKGFNGSTYAKLHNRVFNLHTGKEVTSTDITSLFSTKILILGHKGHGKTTAAELLAETGVLFTDSGERVIEIYVEDALKNASGQKIRPAVMESLILEVKCLKDKYRAELKAAVRKYTQHDPTKLIREMLEVSDIYAGCRSTVEYEASKDLFDVILWIRRKDVLEDDPSMDIEFNPEEMVLVENPGEKKAFKELLLKTINELRPEA